VQADPTAPIRVDIMGNGFLEVLQARDVSLGGLGVSVPHGFAGCDLNGEVQLIVTLGRARPFKVMGVIRHYSKTARDHVFGLEFVALAPEQVEAIQAYIQACMRRRSRSALRIPSLPVRS
jgi:hypothetical protein